MLELEFHSPFKVIGYWPKQLPLVFFGGNGSRWCFLATSFSQASLEEILTSKLGFGNGAWQDAPFRSGYMEVFSYDDAREFEASSAHKANSSISLRDDESAPSLLYRVQQAIIFDMHNKRAWLSVADPGPAQYYLSTDELRGMWQELRECAGTDGDYFSTALDLDLHALESDSAYLDMVKTAISEIRAGRFYQINLLRYFALSRVKIPRDFLGRFAALSGPYGAWLEMNDTSVISFSPEQFLELSFLGNAWRLVCSPIKGTRRRSEDPEEDIRLGQELLSSHKDLAELHMIIDLQRNDLTRVCMPGTVEVLKSAELKSFATVHHLVGQVSGRLRRGITMAELLHALFPSGSITGAPKREVMHAISSFERRNRGYFMGNAFYLDKRGFFDSSVLIRTVVAQGLNNFEFAAGSGIVLDSDPSDELKEVNTKTRVIVS